MWYNGTSNNKAKLAAGGKFCDDCNSQAHNKKDCWGPCEHCKKRNHRSTDCRYKDANSSKRAYEEEEKKKQENAAAKKAAKNEKEEKRAKAEDEVSKKATETIPSSPSSSESEADSPVKATNAGARLARVGMSNAKKKPYSICKMN